MSHCYGIVSTTLRQVTHNVPNYTYLLCNVNPACPINTAFGHTYLPYLHSVKIKVQPPWPSTQLQLSLEHPRAMFPRQLEANGRQWSHPGEDTRTRSPTTSVSQRISTTSPMNTDTTIITAIYHHWYNNLLRYDTSIDTTNYYATTVPLIQQVITILCHYWYNNILCY